MISSQNDIGSYKKYLSWTYGGKTSMVQSPSCLVAKNGWCIRSSISCRNSYAHETRTSLFDQGALQFQFFQALLSFYFRQGIHAICSYQPTEEELRAHAPEAHREGFLALRFATLVTKYDRVAIHWVQLERFAKLLNAMAWKQNRIQMHLQQIKRV